MTDGERRELLELLADKAVGALDPADIPRLHRLLERHPDLRADDMDNLVADLRVALGPQRRGIRRLRLPPMLERLGWQEWLAAGLVTAAVLTVALVLPSLVHPVRAEQHRLAEGRERLLGTQPDAMVLAWAPTEDGEPAPIAGDVAWSDEEGRGYLRFEGLPENNPERIRYRLLVESASGEVVTAAVFDARKMPGDWIVPFDLPAHIEQATSFEVRLDSVHPAGTIHRRVAHARTSPP